MNRKKMFFLDLVIAFFGILLDQFTKYLAVTHLKNAAAIPLIDGVLELHYLENHGAAFGMLQNQKPFFVFMTSCVLLFCLYALFRMPDSKKYRAIHVLGGILIAGAVGNFLDRLRLDYVVDFIYFRLIDFPIFNVADIYVSCVCFFGLLLVFFGKYEEADFAFLKPGRGRNTDSGTAA